MNKTRLLMAVFLLAALCNTQVDALPVGVGVDGGGRAGMDRPDKNQNMKGIILRNDEVRFLFYRFVLGEDEKHNYLTK